MRFVHFEPNPFTTATAVRAHEYAFQFFGGRTRSILYDNDRVFVQAYNYGNIIFVKAFEGFARRVGFAAKFCKPRDPNTKGRVENLVGFVKYNFLEGRTYHGIDSLNSACLRWLDTTGNEVISDKKQFSPREMFREERKHLVPFYPEKPKRQLYELNKGNTVKYQGNFYEMPHGTYLLARKLRVEESSGELRFYFLESGEMICKHTVVDGENKVVAFENEPQVAVATWQMDEFFTGDEWYESYMRVIRWKDPKHVNRQCMALKKILKAYTKEEIQLGFKHCVAVKRCKQAELILFLIYKFGRERAKKIVSQITLYNYQIRAEEIAKEVADGE